MAVGGASASRTISVCSSALPSPPSALLVGRICFQPIISFSAQASSPLSTTVTLHLLSVNSRFLFCFLFLLDIKTIVCDVLSLRRSCFLDQPFSWFKPWGLTTEDTILPPAFLPFFLYFNTFYLCFYCHEWNCTTFHSFMHHLIIFSLWTSCPYIFVHFLFDYLKFNLSLIGGQLPYNFILASAIGQCESAIGIHMSPLSEVSQKEKNKYCVLMNIYEI